MASCISFTPHYRFTENGEYQLWLDEDYALDPTPIVAVLLDRTNGLLKHGAPAMVRQVHQDMLRKLQADPTPENMQMAQRVHELLKQAGLPEPEFTPESFEAGRKRLMQDLVLVEGRFDVERLNLLLSASGSYVSFLRDVEAGTMPVDDRPLGGVS